MVEEYRETGVPFLRSHNVRPFRFDPAELKFISSEFHAKLRKSALRPKDVVVTRSGANTGQCCIIPPHIIDANCFTKSHVKYLEWHCHQEVGAAGRFKLENPSLPTKSYISEPVVADLMDHFDTIRILVSTLGFPLFDKIQTPKTQDVLVCKGKKALAKGEYTEDGLIVFAGSTANRIEADSTHSYASTIRQKMIEDGILEVMGDQLLRFTRNHIFPSPSQAAMVVLARNANGWTEWKYADGLTLDEVKRKAVD